MGCLYFCLWLLFGVVWCGLICVCVGCLFMFVFELWLGVWLVLFGRGVLCEFVILAVDFGAWVRWHLFSSVVFGFLLVVGRRVCVSLVWCFNLRWVFYCL